jgi:hypothetical protein
VWANAQPIYAPIRNITDNVNSYDLRRLLVLDESYRFASYVQRLGNPARITYGSFPMAKSKDVVSTKERPTVISDSKRVRIGSASPAFPPVRGRPANTSDTGKIRIGSASPAFPPVR